MNSKRRRNAGQVSLIMMLNFIPSIMLFAFVINLGMLVHAKINLQNAADAAAYAGAAAEARLMNRISHLNYSMRMNYKKFLYRYYIVGNSNLACFPGRPDAPASCRLDGETDPFNFENRLGSGDRPDREFPSVPSVCVPAPDGTNPCRLNSSATRRITDVMRNLPISVGEPISEIMQQRISQIADLASMDCAAKGRVNSMLALSWVYNTNTTSGALGGIRSLEHLGRDLGIVPANLLALSRIATLQSYVNAPPQRNVNIQSIAALEQQRELAAVERTVLAFKSARYSLSTGTVDDANFGVFKNDQDIVMNELIPSGSPAVNLFGSGGATADLLNLGVNYMPEFYIFYTFSGRSDPSGNGEGGTGNDSCDARLGFIKVPANILPIGVYKSKNHRAFYALSLDAKVHLMFNPFGEDLRLRAYSAAAPFGSRIGPYFSEAQMRDLFIKTYPSPPNEFFLPAALADKPDEFPIPTINFDDTNIRMESIGMLRAFNNFLITLMPGPTTRASMAAVHPNTYDTANEVAVGPDPVERGRYNIPVQYNYTDAFNTPAYDNGFNRYYTSATNDYYHFWAPLQPIDNSRSGDGETPARRIISAIQTYFGSTYEDSTGTDVRVGMLNGLQRGLDEYLNRIASPNPERTVKEDTDRIFSMMNPLKQRERLTQFRVGSSTKISDPLQLATSWSATNPKGVRTREGYSVKIVALSTLVQGGGSTPSGNTQNPDNDGPWERVNPQEVEVGSTQAGMDLRAVTY